MIVFSGRELAPRRAASTEIKGMERGEKGGTRVVHESVRENVARRHGRLNKRPSLYLHRTSVCVRVRARVSARMPAWQVNTVAA